MTTRAEARLCTADEAAALIADDTTVATRGFGTCIDVAPGIDVETEIVGMMDFRPRIGRVRPMPAACFAAVALDVEESA
jgi:acyl CoA:acetate/3-ketoacid CoA transferase